MKLQENMKKAFSITCIVCSGILAAIIAIAFTNFGAIELGALIYFIIPFLSTIFSLILFLIFDYFRRSYRKQITVVLVLLNLLIGILLRIDFAYKVVNW
jgi:hypothetical protein